MSKNQHIVKTKDGWGVIGEGNIRLTSEHKTKQLAIKSAISIAKNQKSDVVIHGRNGKIIDKDSYGPDPCPLRVHGYLVSKKSIHVVSRSAEGWAIRKTGDSRASLTFDKQSDAVSYARSIAASSQGEVIVHGRDGRIRERDSYGIDPCPPRKNVDHHGNEKRK